MYNLLPFLADSSVTSEATSESGTASSTEKLTESLKNIVKSPIFYIVLGAIVLLIIVIYLLRRIIGPQANAVKVIVRRGKIVKLIDENSKKHFLVPFVESIGAVIPLNEQEFSSDKLYINDGPDALYKVNYTLRYKVVDVNKFYENMNSFNNSVVTKINDDLREYADQGHASDIVKDYRERNDKLIELLNKAVESYGVQATAFKINFIEPLGNK